MVSPPCRQGAQPVSQAVFFEVSTRTWDELLLTSYGKS